MSQTQQLREAILAAPLETSNFGETPQPGTLYLPPSHLKALKLISRCTVPERCWPSRSARSMRPQCRAIDLLPR